MSITDINTKKRKVLLFDLDVTGHHSNYIKYVLKYWKNQQQQLVLVVSPDFLQQHQTIVNMKVEGDSVWLPITAEEAKWYQSSKPSLLRHTWVEWNLFCRYAKQIKASHALIMFIDRFQLPLALRFPAPCTLSGIYFRPKSHYVDFENYQPRKGDNLRFKREKWLWYSALRHPMLQQLFCLDSYAVKPLQSLSNNRTEIRHLPDPVQIYPLSKDVIVSQLRSDLGISSERKVILSFGTLNQRKGLHQLLDALGLLSIEEQKKLTILFVGRVADKEKEVLQIAVNALSNNTDLQLILRDQFIDDSEIPSYFEMADIVSILYQYHVGMSGILLHASASERPVLASNYGLIGQLVATHQLGLLVDSTSSVSIKNGISKFLITPSASYFDSKKATSFAKANSSKSFANLLIADIVEKPDTK